MGVDSWVLRYADQIGAVGRGRVDFLVALMRRAECESLAVGRPSRPILVRELAAVVCEHLQAGAVDIDARDVEVALRTLERDRDKQHLRAIRRECPVIFRHSASR